MQEVVLRRATTLVRRQVLAPSGWDEPTERIHRARNVGREIFEEVTVFFLDAPDADPQPGRG